MSSHQVTVRRALLSVSDKTDLVPFARALESHGIEIISTGGTAKALADAGLTVIPIEEVTGFPEMMDGRVKTLHPAIHGALLGRRNVDSHVDAMKEHGISPIDLVCVNLYPFERTLNDDLSREEAIELIDIGGPSMIRSAAKNLESVAVVTNPSQYDRVADELARHDGATTLELRQDLAAAAFSRTAEYDAMISAWMCGRQATSFPPLFRISQTQHSQLRYGENPHQEAAVYLNPAESGANVVAAELLHGKPLSYNNLNDASAALELVRELAKVFPSKVATAVIKHTNPCGCAIADTPCEAFERAYAGDPLAAFGGILATSGTVDRATAESIAADQKFFEVIVAPQFDELARAVLSERWKNVRLLATGDLVDHDRLSSIEYRSIPGGLLAQQRDQSLADPGRWTRAAGPTMDQQQLESAAFLWMVAKHLKSNAIAIGADHRLFGAGAGQMDRVAASRIATEKNGSKKNETGTFFIAASDGFFPFPDGPQLLIDAGIRGIIQPGGSKRDDEVIKVCNDHNVAMYFTGRRHFKH